MRKAIEINEHIIVFESLPKKWQGQTNISEIDYYNFGFRDFVEPELLAGQQYGDMYRDLIADNFSIEVVVYPTLTDLQKLGEKIQDPVTKVFTYTIVNKTKADLLLEQEVIAFNKITADKINFKNNLEGVFAYAITPDGTKEYAIKIGNDGKIVTVLIP
jgi:hypothetical protein